MRQWWIALGPVAVSLVAGPLLLVVLFAEDSTEFEHAALDAQTTVQLAEYQGTPVHANEFAGVSVILDGWRRRGGRPAVLLLGNSQLHAINQLRHGDRCVPALLSDAMMARELDVLAVSPPNASLIEHYVLFEHLAGKADPRVLVIAACFDDTRNNEVREGLRCALNDAQTADGLSRSDVGTRLVQRYAGAGDSDDPDLAGLRATVQEHSEKWLGAQLERHFPPWAQRREARGQLLLSLHRLRNWAFRITPQTKRRTIPARYRENLQALQAMLDRAAGRDIEILVYVVPLRNDVESPYVQREYDRFKRDVQKLVDDGGGRFANLENLVPGSLWGVKGSTVSGQSNGELDFMHFQGGGHRLLAEQLRQQILAASPRLSLRPDAGVHRK